VINGLPKLDFDFKQWQTAIEKSSEILKGEEPIVVICAAGY